MKVILFTGILAFFSLASAEECQDGEEWECANGKCIPITFICDGDDDCKDMSDERDPETGVCPPCPESHFQCSNGRCIRQMYVCDGANDCRDASDERQDCPPCPANKYQCANGVCVLPISICDGSDDCGDGSDEADENGKCPECPAEVFPCLSGQCISRFLVCNGVNNCGDWSDEVEEACPCSDGEQRCRKPEGQEGPPGVCIPSEWVCDEEGIWDCPLGDDEENCTASVRKANSKIVRPAHLKRKAVVVTGTKEPNIEAIKDT